MKGSEENLAQNTETITAEVIAVFAENQKIDGKQ
jgi:hypothetical protein